MALQQKVSVGARDVIIDLAFKKNVAAKDRGSRVIEQADGSWRVSRRVKDSKGATPQLDFVAFIDKVGKRARILSNRSRLDAVAIGQARAVNQVWPCLRCLDRWITKDAGFVTMPESTGWP